MIMEELSIEEKAKAYDEAIKKLRDFYRDYDTVSHLIDVKEELANLFPELTESEDEKIRKFLIKWIQDNYYHGTTEIPTKTLIAWLEKQGEQKPYGQRKECLDCQFNYAGECKGSCPIKEMHKKHASNTKHNWYVSKVDGKIYDLNYVPEPKFKVGEWITHNTANFVFKIINVSSNGYEVVNRENYKKTISFDNEDNYHLWTIQDAKDGDVLNYKDCTFIFKKTEPSDIVTNIKNPLTILGYCGINRIGFEKSNGWGDTANCKYYPATKEQRELLFKKMHEAGYTFDFDKKELKKIEQKPAWSEEDKRIIRRIDSLLYSINESDFEDIHAWLKSLKDRVQPKQEWNEEDNEWIEGLIQTFEGGYLEGFNQLESYGVIDWLKTLKQRI